MNGRRWTVVRLVLALPAILASASVHAQGQVDPVDASIEQLRRAATVQRDGEHNHLLRSLRSLRDPSLVPFFTRLTEQSDMLIRINGILGLAELSERRRVDPILIRRLTSEVERLQTIEQAILFDLIGVEEIRAMLAWDDLEEAPRFTLLAELIKRREQVVIDDLLRLLDSSRETMRASAAMLLVQAAGDREPFEKQRSTLVALGEQERRQAQLWLMNDIGRYRLDRMIWWIEEALDEPDLDYRVVMAGVAAAIAADADRGVALWMKRAAADRSHANHVRLGLVLFAMAGEHDVPAEAFDLLRGSEALTTAIADAGAALAHRGDAAAAFIRLINLDHWQSSNHAIFAASRLDVADRKAVYAHFIRHVAQSDVRPDDRVALAIRAVPLLLDIDPDAVRTLLREASDHPRLREALLMGLLSSETPTAAEIARAIPRSGLGRSDSFSLILIAKHAPQGTLRPDEMRLLGMVASGGGQVGRAYQVQAAWLYLRHAGRIEHAIGRLFSRR